MTSGAKQKRLESNSVENWTEKKGSSDRRHPLTDAKSVCLQNLFYLVPSAEAAGV